MAWCRLVQVRFESTHKYTYFFFQENFFANDVNSFYDDYIFHRPALSNHISWHPLCCNIPLHGSKCMWPLPGLHVLHVLKIDVTFYHSLINLALYPCQPGVIFIPTAYMMTSSNGNIFRVTGPLCGEFTGPGEFPAQRPMTRSFDVFFDLRLKRFSKQSWGWWFETPPWSLWRQCNVYTDTGWGT